MDQERPEIYERIPWENLEKPSGDRQWLLVAIAGAVALGALAYSFMKNQPVPAPASAPVAETAPAVTQGTVPAAVVTTVQSPLVMAEADLFAVDPERLIDQAVAHAEWFAVEYFSVDGSEESRLALSSLMPSGLPMPEAPEGSQVFVDWVSSRGITQTSPLSYEVEVVVRSLLSRGEGGFVRQPTRVATIEVVLGEDGLARIARPPSISVPPATTQVAMTLTQVPAHIQNQIEASGGTVVGGEQLLEGSWRVVAMTEGVDGVRRPTTLILR